jgi:hypothetical protein
MIGWSGAILDTPPARYSWNEPHLGDFLGGNNRTSSLRAVIDWSGNTHDSLRSKEE